MAAERDDAAHGAKSRAQSSGPLRQWADRRGPARCLFDAVGPRHGVGDCRAGAHGPPREARAALLAYFNARPTGKMREQVNGADYQISVVRYFGDGAEEPFFTQEGSINIEFDNWGEALWVLGEYLRKYDDPALLKSATYRGSLYESARDFIVRPLLANTEPFGDGRIVAADTSIWEERQKDKKHFAFSTALAIVGLKEFAVVAQRAGDEPARHQALEQVALLEKGFAAAFIRGGKLRGTLEEGVKNDIDGALIPVINFGVVRDPAVIRDAIERMALLKVSSGGYRRVRSTYTDPKIFEYWYERQEFLFVDLALAELLRRQGERRGRRDAGADHGQSRSRPQHHPGDVCRAAVRAVSREDRRSHRRHSNGRLWRGCLHPSSAQSCRQPQFLSLEEPVGRLPFSGAPSCPHGSQSCRTA